MEETLEERGKRWRDLLAGMVGKDEKYLEKIDMAQYVEKEIKGKKDDRIYLIAIIMGSIGDAIAERISPVEEPIKNAFDGEAMEMLAALGRFGLAIINKTGDPIEELETVLALIAKMEVLQTRKREAVSND